MSRRSSRFQDAIIRLAQPPGQTWSPAQRPSPWSAVTTSPVTNPGTIVGHGGWSDAIRNSVIGRNVNARQALLGTLGTNIGGAIGGAIGGPAGALFGRWAGNRVGNSVATGGQGNWQVGVAPPHSGAAYGGAQTAGPQYGGTQIQMTRGMGWNRASGGQNSFGPWNPPQPPPGPTPQQMQQFTWPPGGSAAPTPSGSPVNPQQFSQINQNLSNWGSNAVDSNAVDTPLMDRASQAGGDPPESLFDGTGAMGEVARPLFDSTAQESVDDASSYYSPPSGGMGASSSKFKQ